MNNHFPSFSKLYGLWGHIFCTCPYGNTDRRNQCHTLNRHGREKSQIGCALALANVSFCLSSSDRRFFPVGGKNHGKKRKKTVLEKNRFWTGFFPPRRKKYPG